MNSSLAWETDTWFPETLEITFLSAWEACPQTHLGSSRSEHSKGALRRQKYVMSGAFTNMSATLQNCRNPWLCLPFSPLNPGAPLSPMKPLGPGEPGGPMMPFGPSNPFIPFRPGLPGGPRIPFCPGGPAVQTLLGAWQMESRYPLTIDLT